MSELPFRLYEALENQVELRNCDFDLLIVDEYQDLNSCDLKVIKLLSEQYGCRVLSVGDDDQSIYSFRSAAPKGIQRFPEDYADPDDPEDYPLTESLRCGRDIIKWANHVILQNTDRPHNRKPLKAGSDNPDGEVGLYSFKNDKLEAKGIAWLVNELLDREEEEKLKASDILILLRSDGNRAFSRPIKEELDKLGIPYADSSWVDELLAEDDNRFFLALLHLIVNRDDSLAWITLLELTHGVGLVFIDQVYEHAREEQNTFAESLQKLHENGFEDLPKVTSAAKKTGAMMDSVIAWLEEIELPDETPDDGWASWMKELPEAPNEIEPNKEFFDLVEEVGDAFEGGELDRFLGQLGPVGKDLANAKADGVRIMTLASSKGLTVRATIIAGCEEDIIPRGDRNRAEEARLLYVGMTRAREVLYCTWARSRSGPTARSGNSRVRMPRDHTTFFSGGPVRSKNADDMIS